VKTLNTHVVCVLGPVCVVCVRVLTRVLVLDVDVASSKGSSRVLRLLLLDDVRAVVRAVPVAEGVRTRLFSISKDINIFGEFRVTGRCRGTRMRRNGE
jgi:hypothetical protein